MYPSTSASTSFLVNSSRSNDSFLPSRASDSSFAPPPFRGLSSEDSASSLAYFSKYVVYRNMTDEQKLAFFPLMLTDVATEWWDVLPDNIRGDWYRALAAFIERFIDNELNKWQKAGQFCIRNKTPGESVEKYAASLQKSAKSMGVGEEVAKHAFIRGLRANLRGYVIQSNATTF